VPGDEYLGGLLDFMGELNRYAVLRATARDVPSVTRCRDLVDAVFGAFLRFRLRNGVLRKSSTRSSTRSRRWKACCMKCSSPRPVQSTRLDGDAPAPEAAAADADGDAELH
jgi:hypothetical protein